MRWNNYNLPVFIFPFCQTDMKLDRFRSEMGEIDGFLHFLLWLGRAKDRGKWIKSDNKSGKFMDLLIFPCLSRESVGNVENRDSSLELRPGP